MTSSDDHLLDRAVEGDRAVLNRLLEREGPELRRRLAGEIPSSCRSVLSVDDVIQQTYVDAFLDIRRFVPQGSESFSAWLTTIAEHNLCDAIKELQAEKRGGNHHRVMPKRDDESYVALYDLLSASTSTPSRHAARIEAQHCLEKAILKLPSLYRRVIRLYDLEQKSVEDVAAVVERSPGAVFMLRARAHRRLRQTMGSASHYLSSSS